MSTHQKTQRRSNRTRRNTSKSITETPGIPAKTVVSTKPNIKQVEDLKPGTVLKGIDVEIVNYNDYEDVEESPSLRWINMEIAKKEDAKYATLEEKALAKPRTSLTDKTPVNTNREESIKVWLKGFVPLAAGVAGTAIMALGFGVSNWTAAIPAILGIAWMGYVIYKDRK